MTKQRKVPKKVKDMVEKFVKSLKIKDEYLPTDMTQRVLLERFDHKYHYIMGTAEYRDMIDSTNTQFQKDDGVWINNFYECVCESGDGLVRIFYDSDFKIVSVQLYRLVAEKEMEIK